MIHFFFRNQIDRYLLLGTTVGRIDLFTGNPLKTIVKMLLIFRIIILCLNKKKIKNIQQSQQLF